MEPKNSIESPSRASARPSVDSAQPMAASTPGRRSLSNTQELQSSPPPEIRENEKSSPSPSSVPAPALAVVPPTLPRPTDVANSSLVQRVPKTFRQITGRSAINLHSENLAEYFKERPKEQVPQAKGKGPKNETSKPRAKGPKNDSPKPKAEGPKNNTRKPKPGGTSPQNALSMQPSTSAEALRNQSKVAKSSKGRPKELVPKPKASLKRKNAPEASEIAELSPSQPVKPKYIKFEVDEIGILFLNIDEVKQRVSTEGKDNSPENMEPISNGIEQTNNQNKPPAEDPDNSTTESLPGKDPPKTKRCSIM